jgi:hypothetical protein
MAWMVENLLRNKYQIKEDPDFESDPYNNVLVIEKAILDLTKKKSLTSLEIQIINLISVGYMFDDIEKILGLSRETISKLFSSSCNKISYYLGGEFTDEGLLEYMQVKYKLTDEQIEKLQTFMKSRFKHKIVRKEKND